MNFEQMAKNMISERLKSMFSTEINRVKVELTYSTKTTQNFIVSAEKDGRCLQVDGTITNKGNIRFDCKSERYI